MQGKSEKNTKNTNEPGAFRFPEEANRAGL
jgi:hypothetical protein